MPAAAPGHETRKADEVLLLLKWPKFLMGYGETWFLLIPSWQFAGSCLAASIYGPKMAEASGR